VLRRPGGGRYLTEDDVLLIRIAKRGNPDAFARIVANYRNFVYRTAYGVLHHNTDAEDVTQETFIKVYQSLRSLRDEKTFPAWLARITVRNALDWRARHLRYKLEPLEDSQATSGVNPHHQTDIRMEVEHAMQQLGDDYRTILVLRELHGFSYEELADILDLPVGTVRSRLHYARIQLREQLQKERRD
jgi:RNA polymerase sigma-70 factor, ECF subfamily